MRKNRMTVTGRLVFENVRNGAQISRDSVKPLERRSM